MQRYVNQLLGDIRDAQRPEQPYDLTENIEEEFAEIEEWLDSEPEYRFGYYCGLERIQFPPADRLTRQQMTALTRALRDLMYSWNLYADLPDSLPFDLRYQWMVRCLDEKVIIVDHGNIGIEFCEYDEEKCPFGEHCTCSQDFDDDFAAYDEEGYSEKMEPILGALFPTDIMDRCAPYWINAPMSQEDKKMHPSGWKSIGEWLGLDLTSVPESADLSIEEMDIVSEHILKYWDLNDDLIYPIAALNSKRRFEVILELLNCKAYFDGVGGFYLQQLESDPAEDRRVAEIADKLLHDSLGDDRYFADEDDEDRLNRNL